MYQGDYGEFGVLSQFERAGVPLPERIVCGDRWQRYGKGRRAFYKINEWMGPDSGRSFYVGYFGYKGDQFRLVPVPVSDYVMSDAERKAWAAKQSELERIERERAARKAQLAANRARQQWDDASRQGLSAYLAKKGVEPEGCRYMDGDFAGWLIVPLLDYRHESAQLVGSQKISPDGQKRFNEGMRKDGAALRLGVAVNGAPIVLAEGYATALSIRQALNRQYPVFMCCDAGNLAHVAKAVRAKYPASPLLFCADDDYLTGEVGRIKAEAAAAAVGKAAVVLPQFATARRAEKQDESLPKLTDFNDLHLAEGLAAVAAQLDAAVSALLAAPAAPVVDGESEPETAVATSPEGDGDAAGALEYLKKHVAIIVGKPRVWDCLEQVEMSLTALSAQHGPTAVKAWKDFEGKRKLTQRDVDALRRKARETLSKGDDRYAGVRERYVFLDGSDSIFDRDLHEIISQAAMKLAVGELFTEWVNDPFRAVVRFKNVVFDPTQKVDPIEHINLFRGLPLRPADQPALVSPILNLLAHLTNADDDAFLWLLRWLAYPLQNPGAKMATAVLMHGDVHGTGKSMFFEACYKPIFGEYATTLGQHQLESQYTAWRSRKLFCLFEEVLAGNQKYSHTGVLKHMITGKTQNIEKKFIDSWEEANHMNAVFLSNALQPFHVEASDRRFLVIWPEEKLPEEQQRAVDAVLQNGGVAAFYHYLMQVDLGGFDPHTKPPMTAAKARLIDYGLSTWEVFWDLFRQGEDKPERIGPLGVPFTACLTSDLHELYHAWCERGHESKPMSRHKFSNVISTRVSKVIKHFRTGDSPGRQQTFFMAQRPPRDAVEQDWLGREVSRFREAARAAGWDTEKWR